VGSQDWMKAALVAKAAGPEPKAMRFVAFEGGGEAVTALQGGHIQVYSGDASEAHQQIKAGTKIRILAVMSDKRLPGELANVPTAKEQGMPTSPGRSCAASTWAPRSAMPTTRSGSTPSRR
jgi:putative tricarboxylic transport membrane protein